MKAFGTANGVSPDFLEAYEEPQIAHCVFRIDEAALDQILARIEIITRPYGG